VLPPDLVGADRRTQHCCRGGSRGSDGPQHTPPNSCSVKDDLLNGVRAQGPEPVRKANSGGRYQLVTLPRPVSGYPLTKARCSISEMQSSCPWANGWHKRHCVSRYWLKLTRAFENTAASKELFP